MKPLLVSDKGQYAQPPTGGDGMEIEARVAKLEAVLPTLATKADLADTKTLVIESKADVIKWLAGLLFAATALILSVMALLLNRATQAPPAQPAPIVIQLPAQPAPSGGDAAKPGK